ncbi:MAG TPA: response regulator [Anaerolineae bacterium]|nr:response regulator [Anaerolineae bacterium]
MVIPTPNEAMTPAHVLVVDDEPEIVHSLHDYLQRSEGYRITKAFNGEEAKEILQQSLTAGEEGVDLVLMDMNMPLMGGLEVLGWLRQHPVLRYTRVVMLTGRSGRDEMVEALSAGADDYITKPYHPQELLARVKTILRTKQLEKQLQAQAHKLGLLDEVSQRVTAALEVGPVWRAGVRGAVQVLGVAGAAVYVQKGSRGPLVCEEWVGFERGLAAVGIGEGLVGSVFAMKQQRLFNEIGEEGFVVGRDVPAEWDVGALVAAPLTMRGKPLGVLVAWHGEQQQFSVVDVGLFTSLSNIISRAAENAVLFQNVHVRQKEVAQSRNTFQAVLDGILQPIYMIDHRWQLVAVNKAKGDEVGKAPEKLTEGSCFQVFYGRRTPCKHCQVAAMLRDGGESKAWFVRWVDEAVHMSREWEVNAYPIEFQRGKPPRVVVMWQERTERRRLEQSVLQAGKLAAIGQLAAGVAHEINNPLTAINGNAQILQMVMDKKDENYEAVDIIVKAGDRAAKVVQNLLTFSRREHYQFQEGDVNESVQAALHLVTYQLNGAGVEVVTKWADDLPVVVASWEHLKSVWLNLVVNARDALLSQPEGERQIEIVTRLGPTGEHVQIVFQDNGPGISDGQLAHIFEPFYTTKDPDKGTGLGLANCQLIVQQHGGEIEVFSSPEAGATFVVWLPRQALVAAPLIEEPETHYA